MIKLFMKMYCFCLLMSCALFVGNGYSMQLTFSQKMSCDMMNRINQTYTTQGSQKAFEEAREIRGLRVHDLQANTSRGIRSGLTASPREDYIADVKELENFMKNILLKKEIYLLNQDVQDAIDKKDKDLLRLYSDCDPYVDIKRIFEKYPDLVKSPLINSI